MFYIRIDPLGEGAKWRRTFGQEIYSPLLLAFAEQVGGLIFLKLALQVRLQDLCDHVCCSIPGRE